MKTFLILCFVAAVAVAEPEAEAEASGSYYRGYRGYRGGYGGYRRHGGYAKAYSHQSRSYPVCKTVYETTYSTECHTTHENVCETVTETQYRTEHDSVCNTVSERQCRPTSRQVTEKQCATTQREVCVNEAHTVIDTTITEECKDIETKVCEETQLVGVQRKVAAHAVHAAPVAAHAVHAAPIAAHGVHAAIHPVYGAVASRGLYKREAEADAEPGNYAAAAVVAPAYAPKCQSKVDRVCKKVPHQTQRLVQTPRCKAVPETHCQDVVREVPDTECIDVPRQQCHQVARQVPFEVPRQACRSIPREACAKVAHKTPRKVCKQVHGYSHGYNKHY